MPHPRVKPVAAEHRAGHVPRKRFGQHFLMDRGYIGRIIDAIDPAPSDNVAEIGPGLGALTEPLLARLGHLHVLEIDRDLAARWRQRHESSRLTVHECDALEFPLGALGPQLRLVGNLPYNISTPLLFHAAQSASTLRDAHFMLQKEVVDRMVAAPGGKTYGRLSVMLQVRFRMARLFDVPPGAFRPPPKVQSAVVRLVPLEMPLVDASDTETFAKVVTAAFTQRRKTLRNALAGYLDAQQLEAAGLDPAVRPETVDAAGFVRAARAVLSLRACAR